MISTKTAKSNQTGMSNRATTPKPRGAARKKAGAANLDKRATRRKAAEPSRHSRKDSKQQLCLDLLCRARAPASKTYNGSLAGRRTRCGGSYRGQ